MRFESSTSFLTAFLAACALCAASSAVPYAGDKPPVATAEKTAAAVPAVDKIAVIGASLSAGWGLDKNPNAFAESTLSLSHVIEASLLAAHQPIVNKATAMFFMDPEGTGTRSLKAVRAAQPSAIVALDYLFWYGYGAKTPKSARAEKGEKAGDPAAADPQSKTVLSKEEQRVADLDAALAELASFTCPILLADLPDMSSAALVPQPMITKAMVPAPETLATMNEHIAAFAKEHKNVVVVPLAAMTKKMQADEEITVRGNTWPKGSITRLMQPDKLHTTVEGACAVWILAIDSWLSANKDLPASTFELDAAKLVAKIDALPKPDFSAGKSGKKPDTKPAGTPPKEAEPKKSVRVGVGGG